MYKTRQATGLDAWASRVKCPARVVSYLHDIYIYMSCSLLLFVLFCLFTIVTWWYVWCIVGASGNQEEVQGCLVTLWLFIVSCHSLYKTTIKVLGGRSEIMEIHRCTRYLIIYAYGCIYKYWFVPGYKTTYILQSCENSAALGIYKFW